MMKKTISIFIVVAIAIVGFVKHPVRQNGAFKLVQIFAMANGDPENPDDEYPSPPYPPGMPQPPPDSIPPYEIPVIYFTK